MIKSRVEELVAVLDHLEQELPVNQWKIKGVDIWPLLKMRLFFHHYDKYIKKGKSETIVSKIIRRIRNELRNRKLSSSKKQFDNKQLEHKDVFFVASNVRVQHNNENKNRFFDPVMDSIEMSSYLFEYSYSVEKYYKNERIINVALSYPLFKEEISIDDNAITQLKDFSVFKEFIHTSGIGDINEIKKEFVDSLKEVLVWEKLWLHYLREGNPQLSVITCYYSLPMFGYVLASKKLNIPCVDMQHGVIGSLAPLYNYKNIQEDNYSNLLPDFFWVWDKNSADALVKSIRKERVFIGGNTWIHYIKSKEITNEFSSKKIILYTLQDGLTPLFLPKIVEAIKQRGDKYQWWIRMHPRMTPSEVEQVYAEIKKNSLQKYVEIEKANEIPLPQILSQSEIHVSNYSGCLTEANIIGVPYNITIHEVGRNVYADFINSKEVFYFDMDGNQSFFSFIDSIKPIIRTVNNQEYQYDKIISDAIKTFKGFSSNIR
ncbi:MAG: hypothetical protein WBM13_03885 [Bacteroidia bacterium]